MERLSCDSKCFQSSNLAYSYTPSYIADVVLFLAYKPSVRISLQCGSANALI